MSIDRRKRVRFEQVADLFNEVRSGYPEALVEDVISLSGIPAGGRILEIGCGPGNATLPYAQRGFPITAVELGERLAAHAVRNLRTFPKVQVVHSAFESWPLEENAFDLAISAEAMHWIPPDVGYPRTAAALKPGGAAAFYWNAAVEDTSKVAVEVEQAFAAHAHELRVLMKGVTPEFLTENVVTNFQASGCFGDVQVRRYPWSEHVPSEKYVKLLQTSSILRDLAHPRRAALFADIQAAIDACGGSMTIPWVTMLFIARVQK
jgi:SAM-dependent methyltransferase